MNDLWEFYKDAADKWRWRRTSPNGNIVGAVTEGYSNRNDCEANARRNGWGGTPEEQAKEELMKQQSAAEERAGNGQTDIRDVIVMFEAERLSSEKFRTKQMKKVNSILYSILASSMVIIAILLLMMLPKHDQPVDLSEQTLTRLRGSLVVTVDPKPVEKVVVFGDTHFAFDEYTLGQEARLELNNDVRDLKENPSIHVRMAGYTSAKGSDEVNQKLSELRANAVRDYLIEKGIAPERISVIGYGRTKPAAFEATPGDNTSKEAKANMRVLFEVVVK